jgi:ribose transport system permease protein/putative xylitol transport system permease protein
MLLIFTAMFLVFLTTSPAFRSAANLANLLQQNAIYGIVACGMLLMIIVGGFDLSVGSIGAMTGVVAAYLFTHVGTYAIPLGVLGGLTAGVAAGVLNGTLIAKLGINPFVATLGSAIFIRGLIFISTDARPIYGLPPEYTVVGLGRLGPIHIATLIFGIVALSTWALLRFSLAGHYMYAAGGNEEASRLAGINTERVKLLAFALGGAAAAVAGLILLGQTNIGHPASAEDWPLTAIAIVVVGGTPLAGGVGSVSSVLLGTLVLGSVGNALNLYNASPYWQPAITGLILLTSVGLERYAAKAGLRGGERV